MEKTKTTLSIRLSAGTFDKLKKICDQNDRSYSYMVEKMIDNYGLSAPAKSTPITEHYKPLEEIKIVKPVVQPVKKEVKPVAANEPTKAELLKQMLTQK